LVGWVLKNPDERAQKCALMLLNALLTEGPRLFSFLLPPSFPPSSFTLYFRKLSYHHRFDRLVLDTNKFKFVQRRHAHHFTKFLHLFDFSVMPKTFRIVQVPPSSLWFLF